VFARMALEDGFGLYTQRGYHDLFLVWFPPVDVTCSSSDVEERPALMF